MKKLNIEGVLRAISTTVIHYSINIAFIPRIWPYCALNIFSVIVVSGIFITRIPVGIDFLRGVIRNIALNSKQLCIKMPLVMLQRSLNKTRMSFYTSR